MRHTAITSSGVMTEETLRVLIVDDYRDGADALGLLLEDLGYQVQVTYSGRQALDVSRAFPADLVLSDLGMPDVDGFRLIKCFRRTAFPQAKVVAITGLKDEDRKTAAI